MLPHDALDGLDALIDDYAGARPDDVAIVACTFDSREYAAWVAGALEVRGIDARLVPMAALDDPGFAARLATALPRPDALRGRLLVLVLERGTMSHSAALRDALVAFGADRCTVIRSMSSCPDLFREALRARPSDLSARNATLLHRCMTARRLRIACPGGTRLDVALDGDRYRWISNRGSGRPGSAIILPAGEVATFPAAVDGTLVADVAFNVNTPFPGDVRLAAAPVTVTIENSRAVAIACADATIAAFVRKCLETPNGSRVGELGFGTNFAIATPVAANSHINERFPGVHLGFGQHNQGPTVDYRSERHLDLIARGGLLWVDGQPEPLDLARLPASPLPHPDCSRDEDVFPPAADDDCCGLDDTGVPACVRPLEPA